MNCKFCKNFIPDGSESCPVCGRRPEEEPIGKLLSENQPTALQPTNSYTAAPAQDAPKKTKRHPKGLFAPLLAIAVSAGSWFYGVSNGFIEQLKTIYNSVFGASSQLADDSAFVTDNAGSLIGDDRATILMIAAIVVLISIIGVIGVITLLKRLYNRIAYKDE